MRNLVVLDCTAQSLKKTNAFADLKSALSTHGFVLNFASSKEDLLAAIAENPRIGGAIFDVDEHGSHLVKEIEMLNEFLPSFVFSSQHTISTIASEDLSSNVHFFEYASGVGADIALKISQAVDTYKNVILPPFTKALFKYVDEGKYTFCTPGHMGGTAFQKSPAGSMFYDFYGENTFKADVSVSMPELGSLLDHSGVHKDAEEYIAEVFNADKSYIVTNGTSTANKIVGMYSAPAKSTALIDRNCHKSLTHLLMMSDIKPIYLRPTRNAYGILGGIPKSEFTPAVIEEKLATNGFTEKPNYAVVTNSTYDGLLYNTSYIKQTLECKYIHFDSAWIPYTNFSPIYNGLCGMSGDAMTGKVFYETQSTHKLLAAFSQSSMIHVKGEIEVESFNEAFMMHTSTSPQYGIVASTETAAAMMKGNTGKRMMDESIERAIRFRKAIKKLHDESESWFFKPWQPDNIDSKECWKLDPKDTWHGFKDIDDEHMYLDPIKVTLLTPGLGTDGTLQSAGIPASLVSKFLDERGIVVEKTGSYNVLFLFSIGVDDTKALQLLRALKEFKVSYDNNMLIKDMIPSLYEESPSFYEGMRIQELARGIHQLICRYDLPTLMYSAFDVLPHQEMTPYAAWQAELSGQVEEVNLKDMVGKINANMILPYPPGVPLVLPGEMIKEESRAILDFLQMLCDIGAHYPGFETDIHGAYRQEDGSYTVKVIKQ